MTGHAITTDTQGKRLKRMRWSVLTGATLIDAPLRRGGFRWRAAFITLTYAEVGQQNPKDIAKFVDCCRKWAKRNRISFKYVWTAELQERGALHYHMLVWLPEGWRLPKPDKQGWWPHGRTGIESARCGPAYLAKYVSKAAKKAKDGTLQAMPKGFRMYGLGGVPERTRDWMSWCRLPAWLRERVTSLHRMERVRGGGWGSRLTGEYFPSPWRVDSVMPIPGGARVKLVPAFEGLELCTSSISLKS